MKECLTGQLLFSKVSGCLVEKPECGCAYKLGFSYLCRHPDHINFLAPAVGALTRDEALELYDALRQKRRDKFLANLDETGRKYFSIQSDFFGQPQASVEQINNGSPPDPESSEALEKAVSGG